MIDYIANEIILASQELHTNNLSTIASELGYQPILIMNAVFAAEKSGKFVYVKKKDIIKISEDVDLDSLVVTEGLIESRDQIEMFIANQNVLEVDLSTDELRGFIPMLPEVQMKVAIRSSKRLATYDITDPKDRDSTYTFVTLKENLDRRFGEKQFDESKPSKFSRAGKSKK